MFRPHRGHHQERQIVSIQILVAVGGRVVCRSGVHFRPAHDPWHGCLETEGNYIQHPVNSTEYINYEFHQL